MIKLSKSTGFSLIELMIVVAIMAILAAIAIPSFMRFSLKAKTSEATTNLAAIRTTEESYRAENDTYLDQGLAGGTPAGGGADATTTLWNAADLASFEDIGFAPDGPTRYRYEVTLAGLTAYTATATGDLDDDGVECVFKISNDPMDPDSAADVYPKPVKTAASDDY